jgi:predicted Zn-dependent protease with MMP-like domain
MHRITLFLDNIWDEAQADVQTFRDEVRATVLHELGHFLGLTEDELFDRDL